jgi:hypothetical protein
MVDDVAPSAVSLRVAARDRAIRRMEDPVNLARPRLVRLAATTSFLAVPAALATAIALAGAGCEDRTGGDVPTHDGGAEAATIEGGGAPGDAAPLPSSDAAASDGGADASSALCPAGSTLLRTRTACPGSALTPPAAFASALAAAAPGDVVSMAGMDEATAPCLPVIVCSPADAPTMLFSDSPESPTQDGVLYADTVPAGRYRLYVYHANGGATVRKFPIVALNSGASPAKITIVRRGLAAPSTQYVSVGKTALLDWFVDRAPVDVVIPAGTRVVLDDALDQLHAAQNELVHAVYDVVTDASLKLSVVSVTAGADAAAVTAGLSLLTRDVNHQRGTFPGADVLIVAASGAALDGGAGQQHGVQRLRLGLDEVDDTLQGVDAPTGVKQTLLGNYGMLYRFALGLPGPASAAISPRGGGWGGVARAGTTAFALPGATEQLATTTDAIVVGDAGAGTGELRLLTGGGSNLPIDFLVVTP